MVRRKLTVGDWLRGAGLSIRNGTAGNPFETQKLIDAVHDARVQDELKRSFGTGGVGGDDNWTPPVHGATKSGRPVTVSFGQVKRAGQTLIADGHISMSDFYGKARSGKGHDHYLVDGRHAGKRDRWQYTDED